MKRRLAMLTMAVLALGIIAIMITRNYFPPEPVYTVAEVQQNRLHNPVAWANRTVLIRGQFMRYGYSTPPSTVQWHNFIASPPTWRNIASRGKPTRWALEPAAVAPLEVIQTKGTITTNKMPSLLFAGLRAVARLPVIRQFVSAVFTTRGVVYRVRLLPLHRCVESSTTASRSCPDAVMLRIMR